MTSDEVIALARQAEGEEQHHGMWRMHVEDLERFAALVAAHERETILDEWWSCVQADLEHGVKFLNEQAAEKWQRDYPQISKFAAAIRSRT